MTDKLHALQVEAGKLLINAMILTSKIQKNPSIIALLNASQNNRNFQFPPHNLLREISTLKERYDKLI